MKTIALSGGVGGAKLALGLAQILAEGELTIVANTGDDFDHLGMRICPDLDTVMYTLARMNNTEVGWGQEGESWHFLAALERLGGDAWFRLGDRDMATHIVRTGLLQDGASLSEVTSDLCQRLGVSHQLVPMSDDVVSTVVHTVSSGSLMFQHYFVRDRCEPAVTGFSFNGIEQARPASELLRALDSGPVGPIIICPSNPFVSVEPILQLPGLRQAISRSGKKLIAVSPIIAGQALKGPAAKMMSELGMPQSATAVAEHYKGLVDGFVIDTTDAALKDPIERMGIPTIVTNTVMITLQDRVQLAEDTLEFATSL
jgi:LPPG:FO 2-phospho-L-lactate transferase